MNLRFHSVPAPSGYRDSVGAFEVFWTGSRELIPGNPPKFEISHALHAFDASMHTVCLADLACETEADANKRLISAAGISPSHTPAARAFIERLIRLGVAAWVP